MNIPYVRHLQTAGGNRTPNHYEIHTHPYVVFKSYSSTIAVRNVDNGITYLVAPYWNNYSATTNRYLLQFLNEDSIKDVREIALSDGRLSGGRDKKYRIVKSVNEIGGGIYE